MKAVKKELQLRNRTRLAKQVCFMACVFMVISVIPRWVGIIVPKEDYHNLYHLIDSIICLITFISISYLLNVTYKK